MNSSHLAIGQLSAATATSVRSLRHYESKGLLKAVRTSSGYRTFPTATVVQVKQIRRMLALGFTLDQIATFPHCMLEDQSAGLCPEAARVHHRRLAEIEASIEALEKQREQLLQALKASVQEAAANKLLRGES